MLLSGLMSVLHLIISVSEWWLGVKVCSKTSASFLLLSRVVLFLNEWMWAAAVCSHGPQRQHWGVLFIQQTRQHSPVCVRGVSSCSYPSNNQQPNNGADFSSKDAKQTCSKWHFYLLAFTSPPPTTFIYWAPVPSPVAPWQQKALSMSGGRLSHKVTTTITHQKVLGLIQFVHFYAGSVFASCSKWYDTSWMDQNVSLTLMTKDYSHSNPDVLALKERIVTSSIWPVVFQHLLLVWWWQCNLQRPSLLSGLSEARPQKKTRRMHSPVSTSGFAPTAWLLLGNWANPLWPLTLAVAFGWEEIKGFLSKFSHQILK